MSYLRQSIIDMAGYVPGFQPPDEKDWLKLNTNENPFPPSPRVLAAIQAATNGDLRKYPDATCRAGREAAAALYGYSDDWVILANGSDELLNNLIRASAGEGDEIGFLNPSYSYYATLAEIQGAKVRTFNFTDEREIVDFPDLYQGKLFFLTNPNAPLGLTWTVDEVANLSGRCAGLLVVDEAYADFSDGNCLDLVRLKQNVVVTRTLSKSYSLAGMRLGLAIARPEVIAALDKIRDHYNLDRLAQAAAVAALEDQGYLLNCVAQVCATRDWFREELAKRGYHVLPSGGNYVFASPPDRNGRRVYDSLYSRKILVRYFSDPALSHGLRISIGTREQMEVTLQALSEIG
ncbi:MAG: histidinol-phosphate transaminase [Deltaproteobacteria bacterium]|jgi:histidinol-phosphate aminotransferase|nr:histidinol-phosphate transaminase [Deltaproteobacteria bacterium]